MLITFVKIVICALIILGVVIRFVKEDDDPEAVED